MSDTRSFPERRDVIQDLTINLLAAVSLLEDYHRRLPTRDRDALFGGKIKDYKRVAERGRLVVLGQGNAVPEVESWQKPLWPDILGAMRETMETHPSWKKIRGTPGENDLPVRAAKLALDLMPETGS